MRGKAGAGLIRRPRLLARLAASPIVLLEAPGGYGKSTACAALAQELEALALRVDVSGEADVGDVIALLAGASRRVGLPEVATVLAPDEPEASAARFINRLAIVDGGVLLVVDEVQRLTAAAAQWLAGVVAELPPPSRSVIAGRRVGPDVAALAAGGGADLLGIDELRFDAEEVAATLAARLERAPSTPEIDAVLAATDGWPAAVALAAERLAREGAAALAPIVRGDELVLGRLLDDLLAAADEWTADVVRRLAVLPLLSAEVASAVDGPGTLDRLLDAGIPVRFRSDGWGELADPVREVLRRDAPPLDPSELRDVAAVYTRRGELATAVTLLHRAGDHAGVVDLLATRSRRELATIGTPLVSALLDAASDDVVAARPELLVELARLAESEPRPRAGFLERGAALLATGGPARRALDAERALDLERHGALDAAADLASDVIAASPVEEALTRGRAHLARGLALLLRDTAGSSGECARHFEEAAALFHLAGEHDWEAYAHQCVGYGCHFTSGALALAADRMDSALALTAAPGPRRGDLLACAGEVLTHLARFDDAEAALREATAIGRRIGDERILGYAAWSSAELACQRRDRERAFDALAEAERHGGVWFDGLAGLDFLAHAAEIRLILGDVDGAARDLARAEARAEGTERSDAAGLARARWEAMVGDPVRGQVLLDELARNPLVYPRDAWLRSLLLAVCAHRRGDMTAVGPLLERAHTASAALGDPGRVARREPELLALLSGSAPLVRSPVRVAVLGRFAVEVAGEDATPPAGHAATLVKVLALRGTIAVDQAVDQLWPEADAETGRTRLRNLLNRLRTASGSLVDRVDGGLRLAAGAEVDVERFEEACAVALGAPPERRAGLARQAVARYTGELLPADRYADWAAAPRERVRRRYLALLDLLADDAVERGDLDDAVRLLDEAMIADPLDEGRAVRSIRALLVQGRRGAARDVADRAAAVADDLGMQPSTELTALRDSLRPTDE